MPWYEDRPTFQDLALVFGHYFVFGMLGHMPTTLYLAVAILFLMLIPPLLKYFRKPDTHFTMAAGVMLLVILLPFGYSYIGRIRFGSVRTGVLVTPFACLVIGILLARCNFYVRAIIFGLFTSILLFATTRQSITEQKIPYNYIAKVVRENAKPGSLVVFWPDYTQNIGEYYFGKDYESISATQFFKNMGDPPIHQNVAFVVSQMPSREPYLYTFKGALKQYSNAQVLWQDKLNMVMQARDFDMLQLRLWYSDPYDLHIFDKAVKDVTQFIFTPADPIFRTRDFEYRDPELCFDSTGRRSAWTKTRNTDIDLTVTLAPGNYILKLHCSPDLNLPAYNMKFNRQVTLDFRTGEKVKHIQLDKEMTVQVPFDADVEQHILPVHIETGPLLKLNYPRRMELGIRIYSISIDLAAPAGGT
jgi:hypothetical protein